MAPGMAPQTRFQRLDAFVQLYKALGGGWNIADPAWTRQALASGAR